MITYPPLDPGAAHDHDRDRDCAACWTVLTLVADYSLPAIMSFTDEDTSAPTARLDLILERLGEAHAVSYLLHALAALIAAIQPGRFGPAPTSRTGNTRQQAAVTVANELMDAAASRTPAATTTAQAALWALEPAGRRDVAALLGWSAGKLLAELPTLQRDATLLLLATPLPVGTLASLPAAGGISALLATGHARGALDTYTRACAEGLLPAMATAWAACLIACRSRQVRSDCAGPLPRDPDEAAAVVATRLIRHDRDMSLLTATRLARRVRAILDLPRVGIFLAGWHGRLVVEYVAGAAEPP